MIAESGEGYNNKEDCLHAIGLIQSGTSDAPANLGDKPD